MMNSYLARITVVTLAIFIPVFLYAQQISDKAASLRVQSRNLTSEALAAYEKGDARRWRLLTLEELALLRAMSSKQLEERLQAYEKLIAKRGIQGLEAQIIAVLSEFSARGRAEWLSAQKHLDVIAELYRVDSKSTRANAYVPLVRAGSATAHYVPQAVAQRLLRSQIATRAVDPDGAFEWDICDEQSILEFEKRWGKDKADLLRQVCKGMFDGPAYGGTGPGALGGISTLSCLLETSEPPRADRLTGMMQACLTSTLGNSDANPFAAGSFNGMTYTPNTSVDDPLHLRNVTQVREGHDGHGNHVRGGFTNAGERVYKEVTSPDGNRRTNYYNEQGEIVQVTIEEDGNVVNQYYSSGELVASSDRNANTVTTYERDADGNRIETTRDAITGEIRSQSARNEDGSETVTYNEDGGYTVTRTDASGKVVHQQVYGADGQPATGGTGAGASSPGPDQPGNTPECLALTFELIRDRAEADFEQTFGLNPRLINPDPEDAGNYEVPEDLKCLAIEAESLDAAFDCGTLVNCPGPMIAKDDCGCGEPPKGIDLDFGCEFIAMCADGKKAKSRGGQCVCGDAGEEPAFLDPINAGGPRPTPVDL